MPEQKINIGQIIKSRRIELGLTQEDLAGRIGIPRQNVVRMEKYLHSPSVEVLEKYALALDCKLEILLIPNK